MGRRVREPQDPSVDHLDGYVVGTRRARRLAEAGKPAPVLDLSTGPALLGDGAAPSPHAYRADVRPVAGSKSVAPWRKRIGATVAIATVGAAAGLSILGGSAAQAQVVTGDLALTPGRTVITDSGLKFKDGEASAVFSVPGLSNGGGVYVGLQNRASGASAFKADAYVTSVRLWADGRVTVGLSRQIDGARQRLADVKAGYKVTGAAKIHVETSVTGDKAVAFAVRTWLDGQPKPSSWLTTFVDSSPARITTSGSLKSWAYLSSSASSPVTIPFSDLSKTGATPPPVVIIPPPTPKPTATTTKPTPTKPPATTKPPEPTKPPVTTTTAPAPAPTTTAPTTGMPPAIKGGPGKDNTGVPAGTKLTVHRGDLVITQAGATYDSLDIQGLVDVQAPNVKITRSLIHGAPSDKMRGVINVTHGNAKNFVLEDSEIRVDYPTNKMDGIDGGNMTLRRVEINGGVDGVHVWKDNVRVESSWIHGMDYYTVGSNAGGGPSHNDGIQIMGGANDRIIGNRIEGATNASIMVTQGAAATSALEIRSNFLNEGNCTVNINPTQRPMTPTYTLTDNVFGGASGIANCPVVIKPGTNLVAANNIQQATGLPVRINVWN